jgi:hypothetical protein
MSQKVEVLLQLGPSFWFREPGGCFFIRRQKNPGAD